MEFVYWTTWIIRHMIVLRYIFTRRNVFNLHHKYYTYLLTVGSLVVRASVSRPEVLVRCTKPPNTLRVHTEYVLVKSVGPQSCALSHERRDWSIFSSLSVPCKNWGGGDS
ncbi:hypothetical protein TNCV_745481 [Trichonephila clavipes]|nr:hypothetical protein TNCV_745481 [Trichonephila clavipes]